MEPVGEEFAENPVRRPQEFEEAACWRPEEWGKRVGAGGLGMIH